ncbi:MAG TPA: SCO6880 family protein [Acidimicrobiales bacterium]|jgi:hypothetical protein
MTEPSRYRFGPLDRRGLIAGWRGGQIVTVVLGVAIAIVALRSRPTVASVAIAVVSVIGSVALATWPVAGRTGEEWLPTVTRFAAGALDGSHRRLSPLPGAGRVMGAGSAPPGRRGRAARSGIDLRGAPTRVPPTRVPPTRGAITWGPFARGAATRGPFAGLDLLEVAGAEGAADIGIVHDARARTYTAVVAVRGHSFALLGPADKEHRVGGWASVLASCSRERAAIHRVQWLASSTPDDGGGARSYLAERAAVGTGHPARRAYAELLTDLGPGSSRHDTHVVVQTRAPRRSGPRGATSTQEACAVLVRELGSLCRRLEEIDLVVDGPLGPEALGALVRRSGQANGSRVNGAGDAAAHASRAIPEPTRDGPTSSLAPATERGPWSGPGRCPWPLSIQSSWDRVRTDATWSATYWIAEWPRVEVGPDFLAPLLLGGARRTVAVVMEPLSPSRATRQVEQARTADVADAELRRRGGFVSTARRQREAAVVRRREVELADGHASFRFSGYVTVTAPTESSLVAACDATEQAAAQSYLELRRLFGDQERSFTYTLPLARGLS